jgi:hypothetical protein
MRCYVDVILRNGFIGLTLHLVIMFRAVYIAYRMGCVDANKKNITEAFVILPKINTQ